MRKFVEHDYLIKFHEFIVTITCIKIGLHLIWTNDCAYNITLAQEQVNLNFGLKKMRKLELDFWPGSHSNTLLFCY